MPVTPSLETLRGEIDARIAAFLDERSRLVPEASALIDEIRRVLAAGGKRLRPAFCYWGFRAGGAAHGDEILDLASSFELLHTFALVHDDIIDSAAERRGQPSTVALLGPPQALLVGDLALVLADAAFWGSGFPPDALARAFVAFTTMREQVIAGQHLDVAADAGIDERVARMIARLKSGSYSIEYPLTIGAGLAGGSEELVDSLARFGRTLGEAFQLRDDLLGLFGDPAATGKPADSDIREGKRHVPYTLTVQRLGERDRDRFTRLWGSGTALGPEEVEDLRALVESSGARGATEALVDRLTRDATAALASAEVDDLARAALEELIDAAVTRAR